MSAARGQGGYLTIVVLLLVVVLTALIIAMAFMVGAGTLAGATRLGSTQAFFMAESGLEYEQRSWAQNLDWYRASSDPSPAVPVAQALAGGTFTASANLPATLLRNRLVVAGATMNVYTTDRFPTSGILQVEDDLAGGGELIRYTGVAGATFTGLTRAQTVGTIASVASAHPRSSAVYPVTILRTALAANCTALTSMQVDANSKFLEAGTIVIEGEEIAYKESSTAGGLLTLTGITRCRGTVINAAHAIGQPVTPLLIGSDSGNEQVEVAATGVMGTNVRYARRVVQR